jgi:hypothetical protein
MGPLDVLAFPRPLSLRPGLHTDILTPNDAALENIQTYFMQKHSKVFFGSWKIEGKIN